jgi:bacteriorhodopsin
MKDTLVQASIDTSLFIQVLTLFFNVWAFFIPLDKWDFALKEILGLETVVQIIELIFYGWYRNRILDKINDVTRFRYYDWFLTTPTMLFSTACFYGFLGHNKETEKEPFAVLPFFQQESNWILLMFLMNALMLLFGYLQEIGVISLLSSTVFGYLALLGSFGVLYRYASKIPTQQWLFRFMASTWSLYGVAAALPSKEKNISYNILDVFAKNFYGLFLGYIIHQRKI